jgi:RHS repeat-associated protein
MISRISNGQTYCYFHNMQGSTVALADSTGSIQNSYRYDPFGQKLSSSNEQVGNWFTYLGSSSVPTVGQYSITTYRLYDARLGRFTSIDPLPLQSGRLGLYLYSGQSPLAFVDPIGLSSLDTNNQYAQYLAVANAQAQHDVAIADANVASLDVAYDQSKEGISNALTSVLALATKDWTGLVTSSLDSINLDVQNSPLSATTKRIANDINNAAQVVGVVKTLWNLPKDLAELASLTRGAAILSPSTLLQTA